MSREAKQTRTAASHKTDTQLLMSLLTSELIRDCHIKHYRADSISGSTAGDQPSGIQLSTPAAPTGPHGTTTHGDFIDRYSHAAGFGFRDFRGTVLSDSFEQNFIKFTFDARCHKRGA